MRDLQNILHIYLIYNNIITKIDTVYLLELEKRGRQLASSKGPEVLGPYSRTLPVLGLEFSLSWPGANGELNLKFGGRVLGPHKTTLRTAWNSVKAPTHDGYLHFAVSQSALSLN